MEILIDSNEQKSSYVKYYDLKRLLSKQEFWDEAIILMIRNNRKITKKCWETVVLPESRKNNIELKIELNSDNVVSIINGNMHLYGFGKINEKECDFINDDPYAVGGECNASS